MTNTAHNYHGTGPSQAWAPSLHSFYLYPSEKPLIDAAWDTHNADSFCANHRKEGGPDHRGLVRFTCLGHAPPPPGGPALILCVSGSGSSTYVAAQQARCVRVTDVDIAQHVLFASDRTFPPGWWARDGDEDLRIMLRNLRCALADTRAPIRVGAYSASTLLAAARAGLLPPAATAFVRVPLEDHRRNVAARLERSDPTYKVWSCVASTRRGMVREALRARLPVYASFGDASARLNRVCARWDCDVEVSGHCGHARGPFCSAHCVGTGSVCGYHAAKGFTGAAPGGVLLPPLPCAAAVGAPASYVYFVGTLNPVHAGHLALLRDVKAHYEASMRHYCDGRPLAAAFLVPGPSAWAEGKGGAVPTVAQRVEMCDLATDGEPWLAVDPAVAEGAVPGSVFNPDSSNPFFHLRARIHASYGDASPFIFFPVGSDAFLKQPVEALSFIARECGVATIVCIRGGDRETLGLHVAAVNAFAEKVRAALGEKADHLTVLPPHDAWVHDSGGGRSSTDIRRAREPWELRSAVGIPAVVRFIESERLYAEATACGVGGGGGGGETS
jgi:hypothetical protein